MALGTDNPQDFIMNQFYGYIDKGIDKKDALTLANMAYKTVKRGNKAPNEAGTYIRSKEEWRAYHRNKKKLGASGMHKPGEVALPASQTVTKDDIMFKPIGWSELGGRLSNA